MGSPLRVPARAGGSSSFRQIPRRTILSGLATAALVLFVVAFLIGRNIGGESRAIAGGTPTAEPCRAASDWLETITRQERAGQWQAAADNAEVALTSAGLCAEDRVTLEQKAINDGLEALFTERFDPRDISAQQTQVDRYHELSSRSADYGVNFPSNVQVAGRAYGIGQFLLAKDAWETAFTSCEVDIQDRQQIRDYVATLFNLGYWWATQGTGDTRDEGLQLLQTSHLIDVRFQIGSGEAWGALRQILGSNERVWPQESPNPILDGKVCAERPD